MTTLKGKLQKNAFLFSLEKRYPKEFAKMLARMKKYVNVEEAWTWHREPIPDKLWERREEAHRQAEGHKRLIDNEMIEEGMDLILPLPKDVDSLLKPTDLHLKIIDLG